MNKIVSLLCGIVFGIGLVISEMINPEKVLGFLNIFNDWDPSLAFVMMGALIISTPAFPFFKNNKTPLLSSNFLISPKEDVDKKLIIGSVFFGAGWGLIGLCPGPAITSLALLNMNSVFFVISMFAGFYIALKVN